MNYELNKLYTFKMKNISFDNVSIDLLINLFKDGRHASHILELWIETNFANITRKNEKDHDFIDDNSNYIEAMKNKIRLIMPSRMIGVGRKYIKEEADKVINSNIYVVTDINDMPTIRMKFVKGTDLLKKYPKAVIPFKLRNEFFNE